MRVTHTNEDIIMPNWTTKFIHVEGREADLRAFLDAVEWQDQLFDFNRIIPMPEILKHTGSSFLTIDGECVKSWYVVSRGEDFHENVRRFTPEEEALLNEIGYHNRYHWPIEHWGTKWNACNPEIATDRLSAGQLDISFDTAWDSPMPVFRRIFEMFPALSFRCTWQHEGESELHGITHRASSECERET